MASNRILIVQLIEPGTFRINFDISLLRNISLEYKAEPEGQVTVTSQNPHGTTWEIAASVAESRVTMPMQVEDTIPPDPSWFAFSSANAAGVWKLDGFP